MNKIYLLNNRRVVPRNGVVPAGAIEYQPTANTANEIVALRAHNAHLKDRLARFENLNNILARTLHCAARDIGLTTPLGQSYKELAEEGAEGTLADNFLERMENSFKKKLAIWAVMWIISTTVFTVLMFLKG